MDGNGNATNIQRCYPVSRNTSISLINRIYIKWGGGSQNRNKKMFLNSSKYLKIQYTQNFMNYLKII